MYVDRNSNYIIQEYDKYITSFNRDYTTGAIFMNRYWLKKFLFKKIAEKDFIRKLKKIMVPCSGCEIPDAHNPWLTG